MNVVKNKSLLDFIKEDMHAGLEKNSVYEASKDKDEFVENAMGDMTMLDLIKYIDGWIEERNK